jgi:hypothetical protein
MVIVIVTVMLMVIMLIRLILKQATLQMLLYSRAKIQETQVLRGRQSIEKQGFRAKEIPNYEIYKRFYSSYMQTRL